MGILVIVAYRPKPGQEEALLELTRRHIPILREQGLVTDRVPTAMQAKDGTVVEVFEWASEDAISDAHKNPAVLEMWSRYGEACDIVPLNGLAETSDMFASFAPISL